MRSLALVCFFIWTWALGVRAAPAKIIIVRHGEKPADGNELSVKGCERAYMLPNFFKVWSINAIYAQQPNGKNSSLRPIQTVTPTALTANLKINNSFHRDDYALMTNELLNNPSLNGKTVVVSWEHSVIPKIAESLGVHLTSTLTDWPGSIFDQAWVITFNEADKSAHLDIVAEFVLPTDIENSASGVNNWGRENPPSDNGIKIPQSISSECLNGNSILNQKLVKIILNPLPH
jgi:hypothetical protein